MAKTNEKSKMTYEQDIITLAENFISPLDISNVPVYNIENCEVLFCSLGLLTPQYGHNITILLPADNTLFASDRVTRDNYLKSMQVENPNLEYVKGSLSIVTKKDVLDGKFDEKLEGRVYLNINVSNSYLFDRTLDENAKIVDKRVNNLKEVTGTAVTKYFRVIDQWTGEGINPEIFKYENGEKVTTFISKKTGQPTPLYVGRGDLINIKLRPYGAKNRKTEELSLRYNLLSIEIVQTAFDRGIKTGGGSNRTKEAPESVTASALASMFGGAPVTVQPTAQVNAQSVVQTAPVQPQPQVAVVQPVAPTVSQVVSPEITSTPAPATATVPSLDFSALAGLDTSNVNLGE